MVWMSRKTAPLRGLAAMNWSASAVFYTEITQADVRGVSRVNPLQQKNMG
ncbi:MAG: hypothetical protein LT080_10460 [Thiobacillus sp.]|nr:hypothetical protein [Thiobacillus sp.]